MAGASITIDVDDQGVRRALSRVLETLDNQRPALLDIGAFLEEAHDQRFSAQASPEGVPWAPLSPGYLASKPKNQSLILVLEGTLRDTLNYQVTGTGREMALEFGTNLIYGATHQFGDPSRNIPDRPFLGLSNDNTAEILDILESHLRRAAGL